MAAKKVTYQIDAKFISAHDSYEIIEPVWWSVSICDGLEQYTKDLSAFSKEQRLVLACHWYMAEVNNGGHDQFYSNGTGIVWQDALEGFSAIGQPKIAKLISESVKKMGGSPSFDQEERQDVMERIQPDFDDLDRKFYDMKSDPIEGALMKYINARPQAFYFSGVVKQS